MAVTIAVLGSGAVLAEPLFQVPLYGTADMSRYETNYFELGIGYNDVSGDGYKFGQWSGLYKTDPFALANFNWAKRDTNNGNYSRIWGYNLGVPSRQLGGDVGTQGRWGANAEFDQITNYQTDSASFIYNGLGTNTLTLPAGFTGITLGNQQPPANAANILPFEKSGFGIKTDRDIFKLGGGFGFGGDWSLTANYRYDKRDGSRLTGAAVGNSGGNPRAVIVPYPVDDNTNQFEVALNWNTDKAQFKINYWYSKYSNNNDSLTWQNAYGLVNGWQAGSGAGFPTGYGRMSLAPDNDFQQIQASGAYNFSPTTRLVALLQYSESKQDQAFLPYTINTAPFVTPGLAVPIPLPQASLNGKIDDALVDVTLTSRPLAKVFLKLNYHYDDRDNKTPENQYLYVAGDSLNQPTIPPGQVPNQVNSNQIRVNLPPGTTENKFTVDADYALMRGTALRAWYQYLKTDYKVAADELRANSNVNEVGVELKSRANELINGNLKYMWDQRRGSDFSTNRPYNAYVTPPTLTFNNFDTLPTMRQFFVADYDQNKVKALVGITPSAPASVQLAADWWQRSYKGPDCGGPNDQLLLNQTPPLVFPSQCQGLQKATGQAYTIDGQYAASGGLNFYAFYTWSRLDQEQAARSFSGVTQGSATMSQAVDVNRNWSANPRSTDNAFGVGLNWKPEEKPYEGGVQYLYNQGVTSISEIAGPALTPVPSLIPDSKSTLNSVQIFGKWQYTKNVLFRANYWYQRFSSTNWAYDNATPVSTNNVLLTGQSTPNYTANVIGFSVAYTGW